MIRLPRSRRAVAVVALIASLTAARDRADAGDKALGEYLSSECVTCHQVTGQYDGIRSIVGWPEPTFIAVMGEYRQRKRDNIIMQTIAGRLSVEEVAALAAYFGSLQPHAK
jgi:cytochrome c553